MNMAHDSVATEDVTFYSGGMVELAARVYHPAGRDGIRAPGVVIAHGFGGPKEGTPAGISRYLAEAGVRVFTWDYRGLGASGGFRGRVVPKEQTEDLIQAAFYFAARADVDEDRMAVYGNTLGSAVVLSALPRLAWLRCATLAMPVASGSSWLRFLHGPDAYEVLLQQGTVALQEKARTGAIKMINLREILLTDPVTMQGVPDVMIAAESVVHLNFFEPVMVAGDVAIATQLITVDQDALIPPEDAGTIVRLLKCDHEVRTLYDCAHFDFYRGRAPEVGGHVLRWLHTHGMA